MVVLSLKQGKSRIVTFVVVGLSLVFLTLANFTTKAAIVVAIVGSYMLFLLAYKAADRFSKIEMENRTEMENEKKTNELREPDVNEDELMEKLKDRKAQEEMKSGLPRCIDFKGDPFTGVSCVSHTECLVSYVDLMKSVPMHIDVFYQEIEDLSSSSQISVSSYKMVVPERLTVKDVIY